MNSSFVTGAGPVRFAGPASAVLRERMQDGADLVVDRDPAHVLAARSDATPEPEPEREQQARQHAALVRPSTMPLRTRATRIPASAAGAVAASHCTHTPATKSSPGRALLVERLVAAVAVVPDRRRRDEHRRRAVSPGERARKKAGALRAATRGSGACAASVHRLSPMPAPARWTTPPMPSSPAASIVPASGSQPSSSSPAAPAPNDANRRDDPRA